MKKLHVFAALITLSLAASAGALGTTAGTVISNTGYVDYTDDTGTTATATSTAVSATVLPQYAVSVTPDGTTATPGQIVYTNNTTAQQTLVLTYTLSNPGNASDSYGLATYTTAGAATTSANVTAANVKYYADTDNNGVYTPGTDAQITANITLAADATAKFFAVYTVPLNTAGGTLYDIDPQATSVGDPTKTDFNNVGRITVKNVYDLSFATSQAKNITTPGTATYTQTLTNTGNTALTAAQIALTASAADTVTGTGAFTQSYSTGTGANPTTYATPQAAINAALGSPLAAGASLQLNTIVTANNALSAGNKEILTLGAAITGVTNSTTANNNEPTALLLTDTSTVVKGAGSVVKTQAICGTSGSTTPASCPPSTGAATAGINVRPGDYVVYYLSAVNSGSSPIFSTKVRDVLPAGVSIYSLAATSSVTGTVLYSTTGTSWTNNAGTLTVNNQGTVYAAVDTNADGTISTADVTPVSGSVLFRIKVKVNDGSAVNTTPQTDAQVVN